MTFEQNFDHRWNMKAEDIVSVHGNRLKKFQVEDVAKLAPGQFAILGNEMGTGKTVEGIALDIIRRSMLPPDLPHALKPRTLVLCPMSVLSVWEDHYAEWEPNLQVTTIDRKNRSVFEQDVKNGSYDVYIMHWDVVRLLPNLRRYTWFHVIADEAHRIGNRDSQVSITSKRLRRKYLTELTGTPCTSKPEQFWSLLNWGNPKRFRSFWRFYNHHVIYVRHDKSGDCRAMINGFQCGKAHARPFNVVLGIAHVEELLNEIEPYYVRRLKEEVTPELPPKYYTTIKVDLHPQQRRVYDQMRNEMLAWVGEHQDEPIAAPMAIAKLARLQQLACAYADVHLVKVRKKQNDDTFKEVEERRVKLVEPSSKLDALMEILTANPDTQFAVYSQSKQVIKLLEQRLLRQEITHGILTGDTPQDMRGVLVSDFQAKRIRVFASTIAAGGVGITLTSASTVVFLDRSWSPAINKQAEDRLHRIGQENAVQVIDIVARNTIDLGRLQRLELSWYYIKMLLGDKDAKSPKPEGSYV
jgi:SNF2 family DNA or RNA helicase